MRASIILVLALEAIEEMIHSWRRLRRDVSGWWDGVDHRERRYLRALELGFLLRHVRGSPPDNRGR